MLNISLIHIENCPEIILNSCNFYDVELTPGYNSIYISVDISNGSILIIDCKFDNIKTSFDD